MEYVTLGRTGLRVSVAGLGCGGFSRLGLQQGRSEAEAEALIREALDLGVNLLDTAAAYDTEGVVGRAVKAVPRDSVVICTKALFQRGPDRFSPERTIASLDNSLRALATDYIDVYQLHGVSPADYDRALDTLAPALLKERDKGKFRHLGITETAPNDHEHKMLVRAAQEGVWEVAMLGFHLMHQNARDLLFPLTRKHRVGTLLMFAVRNIFARPALLRATVEDLVAAGTLPPETDTENPLGFLIHAGGASSLTDAAYRFVRHEPGVDVVLFGTGDREHLRSNIASILKPPLPEADRTLLAGRFGHLVGIGLEAPPMSRPR
jgi:aryl-alcohol dehydrogenase-like predicted oxidoreductase